MLNGVIDTISSIVHFTAIDQECCGNGYRIPAFWVHGETTNLFFAFDSTLSPNTYCPLVSTTALDLNIWNSIEFRVQGSTAYSYINGILQQACPISGKILKFDNVKVYASDPWYTAANGKISNLVYENLDTSGDCD